jgi:DNA uptake protein ComE-like DNA-binding protein
VPDPLRGRVGLGPGSAVVAVLAVVGLVATCWFLVRSGGHEVGAPVAVHTPIQPLARPQGSTSPVDTAADGAAESASASKVVVDVAGKVRRPGIAVLRSGARVVDAIRAAGGARRGVDLGSLNLAQVLTDGEQIVVGGPVTAPTGVAAAASGPPPAATLVDLNTADETTLESLPEVGPVTAQAIIAWRTEHGGFSAVSRCSTSTASVTPLSPVLALRDLVTVGRSRTSAWSCWRGRLAGGAGGDGLVAGNHLRRRGWRGGCCQRRGCGGADRWGSPRWPRWSCSWRWPPPVCVPSASPTTR